MKLWTLLLCVASLSAQAAEFDKTVLEQTPILSSTPIRVKPINPAWQVELCEQKLCRQESLVEVLRQANVERSGGGDIIGNGGGLAEQNFIYALSQLSEFIDETITAGIVKGEDITNLAKIGRHAKKAGTRAGELIFLSGKAVPGLFDSPYDQEVRLAKTALSPDAPILINLDLIYKRTHGELEIMAMPVMVASLVHELGHQVGFEDHSYLDFLGSRVRRLLEREQNRVGRMLGHDGRIEMTSINLGPLSLPRLFMTFGDILLSFDGEMSNVLKCKQDKSIVRAARIENQHWQPAINLDKHWIAPFRAWVALTCQDVDGRVTFEERDLALDMIIDVRAPIAELRVIQFTLYN